MTDKQFEEFADKLSALGYWSGGVYSPWEGTFALDADVFADMVRLMAKAPATNRESFLASWERPQ